MLVAGGNNYFRLLSVLLGLVLCLNSQADNPVIAVASNLTTPMTEIARSYSRQTGNSVRLSFGSSGNLSRQIVQGAPFEVFISAGKEYLDFLVENRVRIHSSSEYIYGEIVFFVPQESPLYHLNSMQTLAHAIGFYSYEKIAIANPDHAPYGVAALQALQRGGLWAFDKERMILAQSVAQIIPFALSGNADMAVIPYSFVLQSNLEEKGKYYIVPDSWHDRISQYLIVMAAPSDVAQDFVRFLSGQEAKNIISRYGYQYIGNN